MSGLNTCLPVQRPGAGAAKLRPGASRWLVFELWAHSAVAAPVLAMAGALALSAAAAAGR